MANISGVIINGTVYKFNGGGSDSGTKVISGNSFADLCFVDENGKVVFEVGDGHLKSANFDSRNAAPTSIANSVLFNDISPWCPSSVDSGYSNPTSGWGRDTKRADWSATDKYTYYEFLEHYYDTYLGVSNNYRVSKRGLWDDGANDGHEVFEYDFCPINYKYTIMLSAGMNADETQGIWGLATFIRCLMAEEEPMLAIAKANIRFKVIPIINASGFDEATLRYNYSNGVNPNFNFNFKDSWANQTSSAKGSYPDSNPETVALKRWVNEHSGKALLWLDLHTGRWVVEGNTNKTIMDIRFGNENAYFADFNTYHAPLIKQYYVNLGTISSSDTVGGATSVRNNVDYIKHKYAVDICGINSAMPEMHLESTGYGADGYTNNTPEGIKCYVMQVRQIMMYAVNKHATGQPTEALPLLGDVLNNFKKI